jgi:hypothetical protein
MPLIDTETSWLVDDVPIQNFCRNVEELGSKYGAPSVRGENSKVSYRNGNIWMPKTPDSRTIPIGMWISGRGTDGEITAIGKERQFHKNMAELQNLLYTYGRRQVKLTKRWYDPGTDEVVSASTMAEVRDGLAPKIEPGGIAARMVVNFDLADPYFYGEAETATLVKDVQQTITVKGDVPTIRIAVEFYGALGNGKVTNFTPNPDHWVQVGSSIATDDSIFLDTENYLANRDSDGSNMINSVTRSGGREWMEFIPGNNVLKLTASSGTGTATLNWTPVYL